MKNFSVNFEYPWLLLLLIPALALAVIPHFRVDKKYRRTRNRIISLSLHIVVLILSVAVLAGIRFNYESPNKENEVILLVDRSDSVKNTEEFNDNFIRNVIASAKDSFTLGIVTFGYDTVYAVELGTDPSVAYGRYRSAPLPDAGASNIAGAIEHAVSLFKNPRAARIVLVSDGVETDGDAMKAVRVATAKGIKVDTVASVSEAGDEIQIVSATLPDGNIRHGEYFDVKLTVASSVKTAATFTAYDGSTEMGEALQQNLNPGINEFTVQCILPTPGLHKLSFEVEGNPDGFSQNNLYNTYVNIEVYDRLLIIESIDKESDSLREVITSDKVTVVGTRDSARMPKTLDELREYDEVILVNVSNADMPDGFVDILYEYVKVVGGGLFTVCGNEDGSSSDKFTANAFNEKDMRNSTYQQLLPVEIIEYTPPVGVVIVVDCSTSMYNPTGSEVYEHSKLAAAQTGVRSVVDALTDRDWVGIMSFEHTYQQSLALTPMTSREAINEAIDALPRGGGTTVFTSALKQAGLALQSSDKFEKKHIILLTDGEPGDAEADYGAAIRSNAEKGITLSIIGIKASSTACEKMESALSYYAGDKAGSFYNASDLGVIGTLIRNDLDSDMIEDVNYGEFTPEVSLPESDVFREVNISAIPQLEGYYGSKLKDGATEILSGEFVPIYAEWRFGKGKVGSFMCDLNGTWSSEFLSSDNGKLIINNMIASLQPTSDIRIREVDATLHEENYGNRLNIYTDIKDGDSIRVDIIPTFASAEPLTLYPSAEESFSRVSFDIKTPGVYEIIVTKTNGTEESTAVLYKSFSYSKEYDILVNDSESGGLLEKLTESSGGAVVKEPKEVYDNAVEFLAQSYDPRLVLALAAIILFLLDVAVRKFKFKWIHELIRDRKAAKALGGKNAG